MLEKELEDLIYKADNEVLKKRGLFIEGKKFRQVRTINNGIADLITYRKLDFYTYKTPIIAIQLFELKQVVVDIKTLVQAVRYASDIQEYLINRNEDIIWTMQIVLIGKKVKDRDELINFQNMFGELEINVCGVDGISLYEYDYDAEGLKFNQL